MILVRVEKTEIERKKQKRNLYKLLDEFIAGGYDYAEVQGAPEHYSNINSGQTTIAHAIKRYKMNICVFTVEGKIYLKRKEV